MVTTNVLQLAVNVDQIRAQLVNNQCALIVVNEQGAICSHLSTIQLQIMTERGRYCYALDDAEHEMIKAEIVTMEKQEALIKQELTHANEEFSPRQSKYSINTTFINPCWSCPCRSSQIELSAHTCTSNPLNAQRVDLTNPPTTLTNANAPKTGVTSRQG
jgi:hypothetical protein